MKAFALALLISAVLIQPSRAASPAAPAVLADSARMKAIYDADQSIRIAKDIDWNKVAPADAERRRQTQALIASGALHTGQDFKYAAFIFQHGDTGNDYLLAHTLALIALEKGRSKAVWIATATLDRYLQTIGQKQIYGTQFQMPYAKDASTTQGPYDRTLISDSLRTALHLPPL